LTSAVEQLHLLYLYEIYYTEPKTISLPYKQLYRVAKKASEYITAYYILQLISVFLARNV